MTDPTAPEWAYPQWELMARERIRDTLAQYNWAGDALKVAEMVDAFCADGVLEIRDGERCEGRDAIAAFITGVGRTDDPPPAHEPSAPGVRRIVRHFLTNTRVRELTPTEAFVESYFTVFTEVGPDHLGRYRDRMVPDGDRWRIRHRTVSTDWYAPNSTMGPPA